MEKYGCNRKEELVRRRSELDSLSFKTAEEREESKDVLKMIDDIELEEKNISEMLTF